MDSIRKVIIANREDGRAGVYREETLEGTTVLPDGEVIYFFPNKDALVKTSDGQERTVKPGDEGYSVWASVHNSLRYQALETCKRLRLLDGDQVLYGGTKYFLKTEPKPPEPKASVPSVISRQFIRRADFI